MRRTYKTGLTRSLSAIVGLCSLGTPVATATTGQAPHVPLPQAASGLAHLIRRDARALQVRHAHSVAVSHEGGSIQRLWVHYTLPTGKGIVSDELTFVVIMRHREVTEVLFAQELVKNLDTPSITRIVEVFGFGIEHIGPRPHRVWKDWAQYQPRVLIVGPSPGPLPTPPGEVCSLAFLPTHVYRLAVAIAKTPMRSHPFPVTLPRICESLHHPGEPLSE